MPVMRYASEPLWVARGQTGMLATRLPRPGVFQAGFAFAALLVMASAFGATGEKVTGAQERGAAEFLAAVASGDPQSVAYAIHPAELDALRNRILTELREEAKKNDSTIRTRLFGAGMPLASLERLTSVDFYTTLARRLQLGGRPYQSVDGLVAVPARDGTVLVMVRGKPPRERGTVSIVNVVALKPYGKDWKAVVPPQIEAQIEDLAKGRRMFAGPPPGPAAAGGIKPPGSAITPAEAGLPPALLELLANAEKALAAGNCEEYYERYMSPSFRRVTSKQARQALVNTCRNSSGTREMLLSTLRIVKGLIPTFEYEGQRATYDLSGQGLPYDRFSLEQVDKRWYIAE